MIICFLLIVIFGIINYSIKINIRHFELKKQASEYLYEKYSRHAVFESNPSFYDSVYFFNNVRFEHIFSSKVYYSFKEI